MNQEQVKDQLLKLGIPCPDYRVVFSGKASAKVNGLYKPAECLIVIHNKNFTNDNALMYTALHEFTHHITLTRGMVEGRNSHPVLFWALFHSVLKIAIDAKVYVDPYIEDSTLSSKREAILQLLKQQNELNQKLGIAISEIEALSSEHGARIEDFFDRHARIPRKQAKNLEKAQLDFDLDDVKTKGSASLIDVVMSQGELTGKAVDMAADGCSIQQIKAVCSQGKIIDPRLDTGEEETAQERLEKLKKKLVLENNKKRKLEEKISSLDFEIDTLEKQLSLFPLEGEEPLSELMPA
jgi:phosphoribosylformylglycinamidine (FGAM) synthase PurS component